MFTGIIQAVGKISKAEPRKQDVHMTIDAGGMDLCDVVLGDSIAVNGVCLTVVELTEKSFMVDVSKETLDCTIGFEKNSAVNLEKALRLSDRLGGHLVSGHVDGVGEVVKFAAEGDCYLLKIKAPHALAKYIATKGSVTISGVSLTVNRVESDTFSINLIPHTLEMTNLKHLQAGAKINLEVDMMARYVERLTSYQEQNFQD
ncbi:riboflavin synthase [Sulfurirhabdus autotrophica]|uniref:Riboflavin synthase n=1 Tax=Sulfurirhabdus autotrophica TaxID=1706046 RepID=A0A4R3Y3W1_9PROT|nr:riboflavin synthase [Sulfurirhabdus autotrophica]TCV85438.1 riboflavin synthase alpha chain [Sulfurirhabdus autotrophica]